MKDPVTELAEKILIAIHNSGKSSPFQPEQNAALAWNAAVAFYNMKDEKLAEVKKPDAF